MDKEMAKILKDIVQMAQPKTCYLSMYPNIRVLGTTDRGGS
jgi:hypothetical protein